MLICKTCGGKLQVWEICTQVARYKVQENGQCALRPFKESPDGYSWEVHCENDCADTGYVFTNDGGNVIPKA